MTTDATHDSTPAASEITNPAADVEARRARNTDLLARCQKVWDAGGDVYVESSTKRWRLSADYARNMASRGTPALKVGAKSGRLLMLERFEKRKAVYCDASYCRLRAI